MTPPERPGLRVYAALRDARQSATKLAGLAFPRPRKVFHDGGSDPFPDRLRDLGPVNQREQPGPIDDAACDELPIEEAMLLH
jgi:hypothetical protein